MTVQRALAHFQLSDDPFSGSSEPASAGNGSLMRLAPVVLFVSPSLHSVLAYAADSSRTTHAAPEAVESCILFAEILYGALSGRGKEELISEISFIPSEPKLTVLATASFVAKAEADIRGSGYCIDSLDAALWCFFNTDSFEDVVLRAANLGDDADTSDAITGQIAGGYYDIEAVPLAWVERLTMRDDIEGMANNLYERFSGK